MRTAFFLLLMCVSTCQATSLSSKPLVIAHRGASGYLPEHTLAAAVAAFYQGADYIEQDLVLSKDGIPIVIHDIHLDTVTNVESVFPNRIRDDGRFYVIDFTLNELKTLRVHERQDTTGNQIYPRRFPGQSPFTLATFREHIMLINALNRQHGKHVGLYPEIKAPAWHRQQGRDISAIVINLLSQFALNRRDANIFVQCFDFSETQRMRRELGLDTQLVQLIAENSWNESDTDYDFLRTMDGLKAIASVADGIGPWIPMLSKNGETPMLVQQARSLGLVVHPYTVRKDQLFDNMNWDELHRRLLDDEVDGFFTDFPKDSLDALSNAVSQRDN